MTTLPDGFTGINSVLVLAPHPDDAEFGCGGLIARLADAGVPIHVAVFSTCDTSLPDGYDSEALVTEFRHASSLLGVPSANCRIFRYPVRRFSEHRQDILEDMITLRRDLSPDLVLMPTREDIHQDHGVIAWEGLRAFKQTRVLCYEAPWNMLETRLNFFVRLTRPQLDAKLRAIACYETQARRAYSDPAFLEGLARVRGVICGASFAEAFTLERWMS
ncbi:PIG-L deacetylase family protein [Yunchengibacter salinarum]|uniref:PIG-L deacetylase family protein n=1 Tax=Yunchengibacter salinarum TaxID=3133399 RepID=UPI0035B5AFA1